MFIIDPKEFSSLSGGFMAISPFEHLRLQRPIRLLRRHESQVSAFLEKEPVSNLFLLSWIENNGIEARHENHFHFFGIHDTQGQLKAVLLSISDRLVMLHSDSPEEAEHLGYFIAQSGVHLHHVVSTRANANPFWVAYHEHRPDIEARLIQNQKLYSLRKEDFLPIVEPLPVRRAGLHEMDALYLASAQMHREETGEDPLEGDPDAFRRHVRYRISHGRTFVYFDKFRRLLFKADISSRSPRGVQISGVYTAPHCRNQGIATRGMQSLIQGLFHEGLPLITLYANETNHPALKVYTRLGFRFHTPYQTVFIAH